MPELPEVETVVRGLRANLVGAVVAGAEERFAGLVRGERAALAALAGARVAAVQRAGKFILLELGQWRLLLHLGMTGKLLLGPAAAPLAPHTHFVLRLADGRELRFSDPRRFGRVALGRGGDPAADPARQVAGGREPLEIGAVAFAALFWKRAGTIKGRLLDQRLLRGLGNIYADEALHRAGIDPRARRLSRPRLERLRRAIRAVLKEAIAAGGSSISDYVSSDGRRGWFQTRHRVYDRAGEPCRRCRAPIRRIVVAGRGTHFCPRCQRR